MSDLRQAAKEYVALRRALGYKLRGHDLLLDDFVDYLNGSNITTITVAAAVAWATMNAGVTQVRWEQRLSVVRGFARHLRCVDPATEVPPADMLGVRRQRQAPHLYSDDDIARIVETAGTLLPRLRGATYTAYFGLLAVTGMRMGEAIKLNRSEVDLDGGVVEINNAKFRRHRRLPLHHSTVEALHHYAEIRDELCPQPKVPAFFVSIRGTRLLETCVHKAFNVVLDDLHLVAQPGAGPARLHGLRHSFATATVADWHRQGADPTGRISVLAAYLGHGDPAYTYWYLQSSAELLGLAAERLERFEKARR